MRKITYKISTLGCKVNQYDSSQLEKTLRKNNFFLTEKEADLLVLNTCAVTNNAISRAKNTLSRMKKENPQAKIVLMGCWPKTHQEEMKGFEADLIWGVGEQAKLIKKLQNLFPSSLTSKNLVPKKMNKRVRYFVKVQDGCEQFCTYCIIPYARGPLKSRKIDEVISEIKNAINEGAREIVLSGIHLGLYGKDFDEDIDLSVLVKKVLKIKNLGRLRLSSIEVKEVTDELIEILKNEKKMCRHLHVPLQSGCDKILKLMNRPYSKNEIHTRLKEIKKQIPEIAISTDVIVGFPGETKKDFMESCDFVKKMKFCKVHVFPYSLHKKTPAAKLPKQVKREEKKNRSAFLRAISKKLEKEHLERYKEKEHEVIVEQIKGEKAVLKSEFYFDIIKDKKIIEKTKRLTDKNLLGEIFKWQGL